MVATAGKDTAPSNGEQCSSDSELSNALVRCRKALLGIGIFSFTINLLMLTGPIFMLQVYDRVLASRSMPTLVTLTLLVVGLYLFMGILEIVRGKIISRIGIKIETDLTERVFAIWLLQGVSNLPSKQSQPLSDLQAVRQFFSGAAPTTIFDLPWVPIYLGVIFILHWTLGVVASVASVGALVVIILAVVGELTTRTLLRESTSDQTLSNSIANQCHRNASTILSMGMETNVRQRWFDTYSKCLLSQLIAGDRATTLSGVSKTFRLFLQSVILAVGAALAIEQIISPGAMIAASILAGRALAPVDQAVGHWKGIITARQAYSRLKVLLTGIPPIQTKVNLPKPSKDLALENVTVSLPGTAKPVLQGLNFTLRLGQGLGVIGPSASGKSTLAQLLIGIWSPVHGSVRIDGATLDQWNRESLGRHIGYLPQEVELFAGSIKDNISRFSTDAPDQDVVAAAKLAGVHEMILRLPKGYDTQIGSNGSFLSGGQKQRIALARALFGNPFLIILDEPNANLDAEGDRCLSHAIRTLLLCGKIVVVMAHRPSAIAPVDMLLMLKDGQQVAFGKKEAVLKEVLQQPGNAEVAKEAAK